MSQTPNIEELYAGVKSGSIKIDTKNHNSVTMCNNTLLDPIENIEKYFRDELISELEQKLKMLNMPNDSKEYAKYKKLMLSSPIEEGERIDVSLNCFDCCSNGNRVYAILTNASTITLISSGDFWRIGEEAGDKYGYNLKPTDIIPDCEVAKLNIKDKLVCEIEVSTGDLIFTNFFKDKKLYEMQKDGYHSINSIVGRIELMNDLASRDVGYAQMGNMSCDVFLRKDGKEIIIGTTFGYNNETDEEVEYKFKGYKNLGNISLSVWRWMCADKQVLDTYNEAIPKGMKPNSHGEEDYKDYVWAKVKPGRWVIEHYYDIVGDRPDGIYSKLYLKDEAK